MSNKSHNLNFELLSQTCVYSMSGFFSALIPFLLLPLLTRYLTPYDYGIIETFIVFTTLLTGVILAGENTLLTREYFKLDVQARKQYIENALGFVALTGGVVLFSVIVLNSMTNFLPRILKINDFLIYMVIVVSFGSAVIAILLTLLQLERKSKSFSLFVNVQSLCDMGLSVFLVLVIKMKWEGRISGIIASNIIFVFIALFLFQKRNISFVFPNKYYKTLFFIAPPFILAHASGWITEMVDRVMINNMIGVDATGLYAIGYRFGMVVILVQEAFGRVWFPFFYEHIKDRTVQHDRLIVKNTYFYIAGLIMFSLVYGFFGKQLLYLFVDEKFHAAGQFVFLISMSYCFYGIWKIFIGFLIFKGKINIYSGIVVMVAVVNIALNYFLIKKAGLMGSAWSAFISFGIGAVVTIFFAVRSHRMPWLLSKVTGEI